MNLILRMVSTFYHGMTWEDRHQQLPHLAGRAAGGATWSQCGAHAVLRARLEVAAQGGLDMWRVSRNKCVDEFQV